MPIPTDQLGEQIEQLGLRLSSRMDLLEAGQRGLREEVLVFRTEARTQLGLIKWIGLFVASVLMATLVGAGRVIWDASAFNSDVKQQGRRLDEAVSEVKQQGGRLEKVEGRLDRVEKRLDGIDQKLDLLIRRTEPKAGN